MHDQLSSHRSLVDAGLTRADIRARQRDGDLERVRRGVYVRPPVEALSESERHRRLVLATVEALAEQAVVSHQSAAVLHGLPLLGRLPSRVSVTRAQGGHGRADELLHLRLCPIPADETVQLHGMTVTSLARTVVDIARLESFDQGVTIADAALRAGLDPAELADAVRRARRRPGVARARRVAAFADAGSASPGESVSRVRMHQAGLPAPVLQWELRYSDGRTTWSDFGWPDQRTLGEFDGKVKYDRLLAPGQTAAQVVMAEKGRENRIRRQGWWLVRWGWDDLRDVAAFGRLIREGFASAPRVLSGPDPFAT